MTLAPAESARERRCARAAVRSMPGIRRLLTEPSRELLGRLSNHHHYSAMHSVYVALLVAVTAAELGLSERDRELAITVALLHDVGKLALPTRILDGVRPLSERDWEQLREHAAGGAAMLADAGAAEEVHLAVRTHHERLDGSGYPDQLTGEAIPKAAQLVAVCDTYEAMTSTGRSYQRPLGADEGADTLRALADRGLLAPEMVQALLAGLDREDIPALA